MGILTIKIGKLQPDGVIYYTSHSDGPRVGIADGYSRCNIIHIDEDKLKALLDASKAKLMFYTNHGNVVSHRGYDPKEMVSTFVVEPWFKHLCVVNRRGDGKSLFDWLLFWISKNTETHIQITID